MSGTLWHLLVLSIHEIILCGGKRKVHVIFPLLSFKMCLTHTQAYMYYAGKLLGQLCSPASHPLGRFIRPAIPATTILL